MTKLVTASHQVTIEEGADVGVEVGFVGFVVGCDDGWEDGKLVGDEVGFVG